MVSLLCFVFAGIAVSGGPDSTALCILASRWIVNETGDLMAFIVDHGLRPESCSEALTAQDRVSKLGQNSFTFSFL